MRKSNSLILMFSILIGFGSLSFSHQQKPIHFTQDPLKMNTEKLKLSIKNLYENILNNRHLEGFNDLIDESYIGVRGEKGAEGFKQTVGPLIHSFPDIRWTIEDLLAEDNKVVVRWKWTGTFQEDFRGIKANQKKFTNEAIAVYEFANNKIIKTWIQSDQLGFLVQAEVISPSMLPGAPKK